MKYLSLLVFIILLSSTWYVINSEANVPLETHIGIQTRLSQLIVDTIRAKKPSAIGVSVESVWTEPYGDGKPLRVKAHFAYRFSEPSGDSGKVDSRIEGEGLLEKQADDGSGMDHWLLNNVKTNNDSVSFEQAMLISTGTADKDSKDDGADGSADPAANKKE